MDFRLIYYVGNGSETKTPAHGVCIISTTDDIKYVD